MSAQQPDEFGRDGDGAGLVGGAVLQAAFLAGGAVVGPGGAGAGGGGGQVDPAPALGGQVQVGLAEHDGLRGSQGGVVQAGVERFQVRAPVAESPDGGEQRAGLGGADHAALFAERFEVQRRQEGFALVEARDGRELAGFTFGVTLQPSTPW